ncbi:class I SAM-dependent methyltransferase [Actinocorallia sp. API 0066]|uniref:class I SAM-dependent methyltransferase n=1 Tax=Actinocorallia sp. API 0066 TaxID=2896846 RepID=UPI001E475779|nr:class I SAM-dependent methyltransferase [Actinocorallia sp. API 0066]MCD0450770.1 class I SAM-dependent methyltransferase [Actinocorallia sp. API 0066]
MNVEAITNRKIAVGQVERAVCERLRALAAEVPADQAIVELGAYRGRSTGWLLLGAGEGNGAHVTTVDPWNLRRKAYESGSPKYNAPDTYAAFCEHMDRIGVPPGAHTVRRALGATVAAKWDGRPVGLLFHDAEHTADAVTADLRAWEPHLSDDAVVVLHDAGRPEWGVIEGAARVLTADGWDWDGREVMAWDRRPNRRGALIVRRSA